MRRVYAAVFALALFLAASLPAQTVQATITGRVLDSTGGAVPNAAVLVNAAKEPEFVFGSTVALTAGA